MDAIATISCFFLVHCPTRPYHNTAGAQGLREEHSTWESKKWCKQSNEAKVCCHATVNV